MRTFFRVSTLSLLASFLLWGCGGGGSGDSVSEEGVRVCSAGTFEPSYANLTELHRFRAMPLRVYFNNAVTYADDTNLNDIAQQGFDEWTEATGGVVNYQVVTNPNDANVRVTTQVLPSAPTDGEELGDTTFTFVGNRQISAEVTLFAWNGMTRDEVTAGFRSTAAHEWGHTLGIVSHSNVRGDLMYPSKDTRTDIHVGTRDLNTIKTAYCTDFGRSRAVCVPSDPSAKVERKTVSCRSSRVVGGGVPSANARRSARGDKP